MPHDRNGEQRCDDGDSAGLVGRRNCLKGIGGLVAAAGVVGTAAGTASASTTRRGIEFDRTVNVVEELGLDPNGNEPIQKKLNSNKQSGTLYVFPEGEYLVTDRILMLFLDTVGFLGKGDVRFTVPERFNDWAVIMDHGQNALFENIDIDLRADGATPGCRFAGYDRIQVHDVEMVGQGIHLDSDPRGEGQGNPEVTPAFAFVARDDDAEVHAENLVARNRGLMGAYNYGKGRKGVWVGRGSKGTVTMRNCHFSGFPNNGLYTSRTRGVVQVEGGVFRNNDVSQVRLGSEGSYVKNALIEVDPSMSKSPNPEDILCARGVRIESGQIDSAGVTVENCDIRIADGVNSLGGVVAARPGGMFDVVDTRIQVDAKYTSGVLGRVPDGGSHNPPPKPHRVRMENVSITGDADGGAAVDIRSRPDSMVRSCCIQQTGDNRDAVKMTDSDGSTVRESTLNTTGKWYDMRNTDANTWGNSGSGSCSLPDMDDSDSPASGTDGSDSDDGSDSTDGGSDSGSSGSEDLKRLEIRGKSSNAAKFRVEVSGEINGAESAESNEQGSGGSVTGWVGKGLDAFTYTGRIEELVVEADCSFTYKQRPGPDLYKLHGNETGDMLQYTGKVTDSFWGGGNGGDSISTTPTGDEVTGWIGGWRDLYKCNGEFRSVSVDGVFDITVSEEA
ncbi:hypothetical protein [Candidatus Halobonum tyrrellensis]|uniref:hypothetical protein n=1 Tax=Candidatus Halobonum tyrrellensis TaxID=1431545 RepID=UPI000677B64C|nr:hypothetical protein [Candidatus Halobonum tyrrellensis]